MRQRPFTFLLLFVLGLVGCDHGLTPPPAGMPSLSGKITFLGHWPPPDSAKVLAVVLITNDSPFNVLPFRVSDLIAGVSDKQIKPIQLNYHSSDTTFRYDLTPSSYSYLGVAELYGPSVTEDWRAVGYAHEANGAPRKFTLGMGDNITDANITVNFDSLPSQPFVK